MSVITYDTVTAWQLETGDTIRVGEDVCEITDIQDTGDGFTLSIHNLDNDNDEDLLVALDDEFDLVAPEEF